MVEQRFLLEVSHPNSSKNRRWRFYIWQDVRRWGQRHKQINEEKDDKNWNWEMRRRYMYEGIRIWSMNADQSCLAGKWEIWCQEMASNKGCMTGYHEIWYWGTRRWTQTKVTWHDTRRFDIERPGDELKQRLHHRQTKLDDELALPIGRFVCRSINLLCTNQNSLCTNRNVLCTNQMCLGFTAIRSHCSPLPSLESRSSNV